MLKLIAAERKPIFLAQYRVEGRSLIVRAPPSMEAGTYLFSWRVISTDGHPVAGSGVFSIAAPSRGFLPQADDAHDPLAAENERLRAVIREAQEAIEQHKVKGPGSVDFDGILARLRDALARRL